MPRFTLRPVFDWLLRMATSPRDELTRWQRAARFVYDLFRHGARRLVQDRATQMAAALTYRTLFGLLPVLVVTTVLFRAFRGFDRLRGWLERTFTSLGLDTMRVQAADGESAVNVPVAPVASSTPEVETLSDWLLGLVEQVETINFAAVGWVGLAVLIYSAISLMVTIENSFNTVYGAPSGRSWARRLPVYWTVLTLSPLAIGVMVYVNTVFGAWIQTVNAWQWVLAVAQGLWGFAVTWLIILLAYRLVPSTAISLRAVMIGAFVTALLVEAGRRSLGAYTENLLSLRQLYGSLGLIPLFMFWVYLMWLVILFGLEVAATLQMLGGRRLEDIRARAHRPSGLVDPAAVIVVMSFIADRFRESVPVNSREIADAADLPEAVVALMLERLVEEKLLHSLEGGEDGAFTLARPPELIEADRLIEIGFELAEPDDTGDRFEFLRQLRQAQRTLAGEKTLASLARPATA